MKPGAVHIASRCRAPLLVEKTWCRRYLRLPTWDRSLVPLPFNRIVHLYAGPFIPPTDSTDQDAIARCLELLEQELDLLAADARQRAGDPADEAWLALFPERLRDAMRRAAPRPLDRHMEQLDALEELLGKPLPRDAQRLAEVDQKA